jgi:hypothetical protein
MSALAPTAALTRRSEKGYKATFTRFDCDNRLSGRSSVKLGRCANPTQGQSYFMRSVLRFLGKANEARIVRRMTVSHVFGQFH